MAWVELWLELSETAEAVTSKAVFSYFLKCHHHGVIKQVKTKLRRGAIYEVSSHCCAGRLSLCFHEQSYHANSSKRYILLKLVVSLSNRLEA